VYRFAVRLTGDHHQAEDLTQETLLRAWRHRRRLRDPEAARVWLFRIAVNLWRDQVRRAKRSPKPADRPCEDPAATIVPPDRMATDREDLDRALKIMDSLPPRQREVLYLSACEGLSLDQIAAVLDVTAEAAKASLCLARKKMRDKLPNVCPNRFPTA
jgi:RNA polymerase sigma-70 factor (ECF subfamily)